MGSTEKLILLDIFHDLWWQYRLVWTKMVHHQWKHSGLPCFHRNRISEKYGVDYSGLSRDGCCKFEASLHVQTYAQVLILLQGAGLCQLAAFALPEV